MAGERCPKCGRLYLYDNAPESDKELCFARELPDRADMAWCMAGELTKLREENARLKEEQARTSAAGYETLAKIRRREILLLKRENARLRQELEDVHQLDGFSARDKRLYAAHPVVRMNGYWSVVIGPGVDITRGTAPEARRAAVEHLKGHK